MTPPPLVQAAQELLQFLKAQDRVACLIGGMVVARWGEPRGTQDVDATVLVDFGEEFAVLELLLSKFRSRDPLPAQRAEFGRLVLLTASNGVDLDVSGDRRAAGSTGSLRSGPPEARPAPLTDVSAESCRAHHVTGDESGRDERRPRLPLCVH